MHVYIHIPFCVKKCAYCNFYSVALHDAKSRESLSTLAEYTNNLINEIKLCADPTLFFQNILPSTLFIGGGTPSLLPLKSIRKIYDTVLSGFDINEISEFTIEANPESMTLGKVFGLPNTGINRISIGIQSLNDDILKFLGRIHNRETGLLALQLAFDVGIENISADLIYGIPGLTNQMLKQDIETLVNLGVKHISLYSLTIEEGSKFWEDVKQHNLTLPSSDKLAEQYYSASELLKELGFSAYELSNFALPGYECQHNMAYWLGESYLGFGPSAHSYHNFSRWANVSNLKEYNALIGSGKVPLAFKEDLTPIQQLEELIMTRLRTLKGVNIIDIDSIFRDAVIENAKPLIDNGILEIYQNYLRLRDNSRLLADGVAAKLITAVDNESN